MKKFLSQIANQFYNARRFFIIPLGFLIFHTIIYCTFYFLGIYKNITEKILLELLMVLWILSPLLVCSNIFIRICCTFIMVINVILNVSALIAAIVYRVDIVETIWEVMASSSWQEIKEFLSEYSFWAFFGAFGGLIISAIGCAVLIFMVTGKKIVINSIRINRFSINLPYCLCVIPFTILLLHYICSSRPLRILKKSIATKYAYYFIVHKAEVGALSELNKHAPPYEAVKFNPNTSDLLCVTVIGESATRLHWGAYGYPRNTTPYISQIKNELLLFDNIFSSSPITPDALKYFFTNANLKDNSFSPDASLPQILKYLQAETYYISNQGNWGSYNMPSVLLFAKTDETKFLNSKYDEAVLAEFTRLLNQPSQQRPRYIFIHLLGSHRPYNLRFPEKDAVFNSDFRDHLSYDKEFQSKNDELNSYDSSIAYTDKVLKKIIEQLKEKKEQPVLFFYFSDHGEVLNAAGRDKRTYECTRQEVFEIPFVIWMNEKYRKTFPDIMENGLKNQHKLAQTDRLFPSLCSMMQISWKNFPHTQNIFSQHFVPMKNIYSMKGTSTLITDKNGDMISLKAVKE